MFSHAKARVGCPQAADAGTDKRARNDTGRRPEGDITMPIVELYDTTLRDGAQQEGISLSVEDKLAITGRLDALGIDYIEGGYAGANPKDDEFFRRVR